MTIQYIKEDGTIYAISEDCEYKKRMYDELMWAEIETNDAGDVLLKWEDDYMKPVICESVSQAKTTIQNDHMLHTPHVNGASYEIK